MFVDYNILRSKVLMHKYKVGRKGRSKSYIFAMHFWIGVELWPFWGVLKPKCDERLGIRGSWPEYGLRINISTNLYATLNDSTRITRNTRPQFGALLPHRSIDCTPLHLPLWINNDTCIIFKIEINAV
jgi:hypothetical protein